tara:strand:+ start:214 stop:978 length:765 start_codon:yes stop_codon:yes gene_type:complete
MSAKLDSLSYEARLKAVQNRLREIELAYMHSTEQAIIVFEGWDAAGKGGVIRRLTACMDPRGFKVWPIAAPDEHERQRHYLYRFWRRLPEHGTIAIFDRSWYGRVLVERVNMVAQKEEWKRAYREINEFEHQLLDDGVRIVKIFLHITADKQLDRFRKRMDSPLKRWKLTCEDIENAARRKEYTQAIEDMLEKTSTQRAPWHLIAANNKAYTRIHSLELIADKLSEGIIFNHRNLDPEVAALAKEKLGLIPSSR